MGTVEEVCVCGEPLLRVGLLTELLRYTSACRLAKTLAALAASELPGERQDGKGLMTVAIFEGLQSAAVQCVTGRDTRHWVHPVLDVHRQAKVRVGTEASNLSSTAYTLEGVALTKGRILGVIRDNNGTNARHEVSVDELRLAEEASLFHDELLPAVECIQPQRTSRSARNWFLEKLCGAPTKLLTSFNQKRRKAWALTDRLLILFYEERRRLAELKARMQREESAIELKGLTLTQLENCDVVQLEIRICDKTDSGWFQSRFPRETVRHDSHDVVTTLEIQAEHVARLRRLALCSEDIHFRFSLALVLLRYAGLSGGEWQLESGWHAGVPPSVFAALVSAFHVTVECFASPLNCTLSRYFSAFPDTDAFFGCCGNFFASPPLVPLEGDPLSLEANPPFDHGVIAAGLERALRWLEDTPATTPLSFVFILPDSAQANGVTVRKSAEKSRFFRGGCVVPSHTSMYVHGACHVEQRMKRKRPYNACASEEELVVLSCATRLLVLQNDAAAAMLSASEGITKVRSAWEALSASVAL
ncbi:putative phosphorylated CTD-interacting factor 1-like [Trypanosoma rangeli]|uniref:Putative phosphorylated CTD-interacting factor 1-like n=1 Tax=Trypanosoma rangeli TaxID=5698 RepID=A0A422NKA3_TRYRA|nr:putative phosphorylated CTD-interacting factor 1-like [Trypanosoma rangeli]RNF05948.1 putative phosphorylated CTD-interacting factor 1-like [Trypanosoma rangeli]|eukprot:RNF05948.1 putative phosphorylated CTD-interacting factor 1-like [Trypanosoma rangeli]